MYLVPEDVIQTWRNEQRSQQVDKPVETALSQIDTKMQNILNANNIHDYDKEKLYTQHLGTFVNMRENNGTPQPTPPSTNSKELPNDIMLSIPKTYRTKAEAFLNYLQTDKDVSWDDQGQLVLNGKVIPKSHIVDLMHDAMRKRKKIKRPKGWQELSRHLAGKNVPKELVGNETWFHDSPKQSVSFTPNPKVRKSKQIGKQRIRQWISIGEKDDF